MQPPLLTQNLILGSMQTLSTISRLSPVPQQTPLANVPANTGFALFITVQFRTNMKLPSMFELCSAVVHVARQLLPGSLLIYSRNQCNILLTCDKLHLQATTKPIL